MVRGFGQEIEYGGGFQGARLSDYDLGFQSVGKTGLREENPSCNLALSYSPLYLLQTTKHPCPVEPFKQSPYTLSPKITLTRVFNFYKFRTKLAYDEPPI